MKETTALDRGAH